MHTENNINRSVVDETIGLVPYQKLNDCGFKDSLEGEQVIRVLGIEVFKSVGPTIVTSPEPLGGPI